MLQKYNDMVLDYYIRLESGYLSNEETFAFNEDK